MRDNTFSQAQLDWLTDLESGGFQQGTCALHDKVDEDGLRDRFCCLGLIALKHYERLKIERVEMEGHNQYKYGHNHGCLDQEFVDTLNLRGSLGEFYRAPDMEWKFYPGGLHQSLASLNDCGTVSFKMIAKFIRQFPWVVFMNFDILQEKKRFFSWDSVKEEWINDIKNAN